MRIRIKEEGNPEEVAWPKWLRGTKETQGDLQQVHYPPCASISSFVKSLR